MKRTTVAALAAALLLTLTGCAESAGNAADERTTAEASEASTPSTTPEPLVAEGTAESVEEADEQFLAYVRSELAALPTTGIGNAADEQLIAAGHDACEQLRAGVEGEDIRLIDGEEVAPSGYYMDSGTIVSGARIAYCPETIY